MALPNITDEERKAALKRAAEVRRARADLRADLESGKVTVEQVLANSDDPIPGKLKVSMLIESLPGYGKAKAAKIMEEINIAPSRRVQGLGTRQRAALLERLNENR